MGAIQPWHLILLLVVVLIVFGPGKLPDIGKALGQSMREFRDATKGMTDAISGEQSPPPATPQTMQPPVQAPPQRPADQQPPAGGGSA